jgi:hypothetical protein
MQLACPLALTLALVLTGCSGHSGYPPATPVSAPAAPAGPAVAMTVTIGAPVAGAATLSSTFAGFSYEKSKLNSSYFNSGNTALVTLFKRLGPGILRVGGNSVDSTSWNPNGPGLVGGRLAPADVDRLAGFLRAVDWQVIYGLNFATNTPAGMASEAAYAAGSLGDRLYGFELGNEPDLYHSNGLRPATYHFADFLAEWQAYAAAISAQVPAAVFTGPASAGNLASFTEPFALAEGPAISLLTQHYYRANGQSASSTLALLLKPDPGLPVELQALATAATGISGGYRLDEANSFYNGGAPGISDAYGTSLWAVDFLFTNALYGSTGVNFHGGGNSTGYTPIADANDQVVEVRPEYYGMYLFSRAAKGQLLGTSIQAAASIPCSAYAVAVADGDTILVLVNKDPVNNAQVQVDLPGQPTVANLTLLTGPSLAASTGQTLNGAAIAADGSWTPAAADPQALAGTSCTFYVPPASALLVRASR